MMVTGFAFVIGFAAAGGVLQLGATIMAMSFPNGKGKAILICESLAVISGIVKLAILPAV
jgi:hypothetical protein